MSASWLSSACMLCMQVNNRLMEKANLGLMGLQQPGFAPPPQCASLALAPCLPGAVSSASMLSSFTPAAVPSALDRSILAVRLLQLGQ